MMSSNFYSNETYLKHNQYTTRSAEAQIQAICKEWYTAQFRNDIDYWKAKSTAC